MTIYNMKRIGHVTITSYGDQATCHCCRSILKYTKGSGLNLKMWGDVVKSFINKHKECKLPYKEHSDEPTA